eukprot:4677197-Prymnesium_polylepis.1
MGSHRHTGTRTLTHTPVARGYVPACPDGAPRAFCVPASTNEFPISPPQGCMRSYESTMKALEPN